MALPVEVLKKVKLLEIRTRKLVNNLFAGQYHTHFKGQGMTFSDFREYVPGDDVRSISWPLTAKTGVTHIKKFEEERELTIILAVDISGSTEFGTGKMVKGEIIAQMAALLGFVAVRNNDQVGLLLFSSQVEHFVPPKKGRGNILRILRDLYFLQPRAKGTKLAVACEHLQGVLKKRATIFLISDFFDAGYEKSLRQLASKHEVVACVVNDPAENNLPDLGLLELVDSETGEHIVLDSSAVGKFFVKGRQAQIHQRDKLLRQCRVARVDISTQKDYLGPLTQFFARRGGRRGL